MNVPLSKKSLPAALPVLLFGFALAVLPARAGSTCSRSTTSHSTPSHTTTTSATGHGTQSTGEQATLKGRVRALDSVSGTVDPMVPHATITIPKEGGGTEVCYVNGWAGVILARDCDGKEVEVSGCLSSRGGTKTLLGKSTDVKVGGKPVEGCQRHGSTSTTSRHH